MALSLRVERLKREYLKIHKSVCPERTRLITESYKATEGEHPYIRRAKALQHILENKTIYIREGELLVGSQAAKPAAASVYPETGANWVLDELDTFATREMRKFEITEEAKAELRELLPYWEHQTILYRSMQRLNPETKFQHGFKYSVISPNLNLRGHVGHFIPNYGRIVRDGFQKVEQDAREYLAALNYAEPGSLDKGNFYESILIICQAIKTFAERYAKEAIRQSEEPGVSEQRKKELLKIAEVCNRVPYYGARNFQEALQSLWFIHLTVQIEGDGFAFSFGRVDQFLIDFYNKDVEENGLTEAEAQELVDCFCLKCNEIVRLADVPPKTSYFGGVNMTQNMVLGGQLPDGSDGYNTVSKLFLRGDENVHLDQPNTSIRVYEGSTDEFLLQAISDIKSGGGKPAIFNDKAIIPSLMKSGEVTLEQARTYGIVGCVEPVVSNGTNGWTNAAMLNMAKCLELALHDGVEPFSGQQLGPKTGKPEELTTYEAVEEAYKRQISYFVKQMVTMLNTWDQMHGEFLPIPFMSAMIDGCMEKGLDVSRGGAQYNFVGVQGVGLTNVTDSLKVLKDVVFEQKKLSLSAMVEMLDQNFEGNEYFRIGLVNKVAKFGNNEDEVDLIARRIGKHYCDEVSQYKNVRGGYYRPGLFPVASHVPLGAIVGALPSGRLSGTPLNDGISPVSGCDVNGPTSVLLSVSRINHVEVTNGTLLNMKLHPTALKTREDMQKLISLIRTFSELGLMHVQFNVVSREELLAAQEDPESHRDLIVRVAGYSANFVDLDRKMQDDIINRTQQAL